MKHEQALCVFILNVQDLFFLNTIIICTLYAIFSVSENNTKGSILPATLICAIINTSQVFRGDRMKEVSIHIAENIARLRKEHNETQIQLADAIGVSNKTISKWEKGESEPELMYVAAVAEYYGVSIDSLLKEETSGIADNNERHGLTYRDAALNCFYDGIESTFRFMANTMLCQDSAEEEHYPLLPRTGVSYKGNEGTYTGAQTPEIFIRAHSSPENNMLITLMQNEDNYGWLEREADNLREIFALFAEPNVLSLIRFIHTDDTPVRMTAEYASEKTGCDTDHVRKLFERMGAPNEEIEFSDGRKKVYTVCGDGYILTALAAVYEAFLSPSYGGTMTRNSLYKPIFRKQKGHTYGICEKSS